MNTISRRVEAWPEDLSELGVTAGFSRIVSAASRPWPDPDIRVIRAPAR